MILPVYAYGHPVLKKMGSEIDPSFDGLDALIEDMWETMYYAKGVGLAAPQVGHAIRLFVVDTIQIQEEGEEEKGIKKVFINAQIMEETGDLWTYEEGCLSIPNITGDVERKKNIHIRYLDENFLPQEEKYEGMNARVIQHEYDHIEGRLFTEKLNPLKKKLIQRKLENIRKGKVNADYRMRFASI
ncbi:MAG: peptide deformylase [Saprospiraceae bacterium]|nr:peptide deformylase [Saprospiraceae bacterium]MBL0081561.1 peptide deformylase [Saprospiraceae bacterium]